MINDLDIVQWGYLLDPAFQLINSAGKPLTNGYIEVYYHGTRNKYYCASDFDGTLHPFKIPLDSLGSNIVLADPGYSYDIYIYNAFGSLVMSRYNVTPGKGGEGSGGGGVPGSEMPEHWLGMYGSSIQIPGTGAGTTLPVPTGNDVDYEGDFIDHIEDNKYIYLKEGLYLVECVIRFEQSSSDLKNELGEVLVYTGRGNANEDRAWQEDLSGPDANGNRHCLKMSFIRLVQDGTHHGDSSVLYFAPGSPVNWSWAQIQNLSIVKLEAGGGAAYKYLPGDYITIDNRIISVTGLLPESASANFVTNDTFNETVNNIYGDINNVSSIIEGDINTATSVIEGQITNITGDIVNIHNDITYVSAAVQESTVSGITRQELVAVSGVLENDIQTVSAAIPELPQEEEVEFEELDVDSLVTNDDLSAVTSVINNTIETVSGTLGDKIDAVSAAVVEAQVNADWDAVSGKAEILNKPDLTVYATHDELETVSSTLDDRIDSVSASLPETEEVTFEELDVDSFATHDEVAGVSATIEGDILSVSTVIEGDIQTVSSVLEYVSGAVSGFTGDFVVYTGSEYDDFAQYTQQIMQDANDGKVVVLHVHHSHLSDSMDRYGWPTAFYHVDGSVYYWKFGPFNNDNKKCIVTTTYNHNIGRWHYEVEDTNADWNAVSGFGLILNKPDLSNFVSNGELEAVTSVIEGNIESVSTVLEGDIQTVSAVVDSVSASLPETEEVTFEELDVNSFATHSEVSAMVGAVSSAVAGDISAVSTVIMNVVEGVSATIEGDIQSVSTTIEGDIQIVSAAIPTIQLDADNKVSSISGYEIAGGSNVTTEVGQFTVHPNTEGGDVTVIYPTDVAAASAYYDLSANYDAGQSASSGNYKYFVFRSPGYDSGTWSAQSGDVVTITISADVAGAYNLMGFYVANASPAGTNGPTINYPSTSQLVNTAGSPPYLPAGTYTVALGQNPAGSSYGKYITIYLTTIDGYYNDDFLDKVAISFGKPNPALGPTVNLDRYALGNTITITNTTNYPQAPIYTDPTTKKQTVYLPNSMPGAWTANNNIMQSLQYGTLYDYPNDSNYSTKQYRAYKYTSSPRRYQFAYCTDWDYANKVMTFIAYDDSGNAIEKWTLDYTTYGSNVWTTSPIASTQVNADWDAVSGVAEILNKPTETDVIAGEGITITETAQGVIISSTVSGDVTMQDLVAVSGTLDDKIDAVSAAVPSAQVQSDWDETNTSDPAYIQNKPTAKQLIAGSNINITETANGVTISSTATGDVTEADLASVSGNLESDIQTVSSAIPSIDGLATEADLQAVSAAIPDAQVNADWDAVSGKAEILNKPQPVAVYAGTGISLVEDASGITISVTGGGGSVTGGVTYAELAQVSGVLEQDIQTVSASITLSSLNTAGITDIQLVNALPASPVSSVLYLIPET